MSISAISAFDWSFWLASVLANWIEGLHISKSKPSFLKRGPVEGVSPLRSETLTEIGVGHLAAMVTQPPTRWIYPNAKKLKWIDIQYIYIYYIYLYVYIIFIYISYIYIYNRYSTLYQLVSWILSIDISTCNTLGIRSGIFLDRTNLGPKVCWDLSIGGNFRIG